MATPINWPSYLPTCAQTWQEKDAPDVIRTEMDMGLPKQRRRSTLRNTAVNVSWTLPVAQFDQFDQFYLTATQQGVIPFYFAHPVTGNLNTYTFVEAPQYTFLDGTNGVGAVKVDALWERRP